MAESKPTRMYKDGQTIGKDEEGKPKVVKSAAQGAAAAKAEEANPEGEVATRHVRERHDLYTRHEHEHSTADRSGKTDKAEMHKRHQSELAELHKRHEKELAGK